MLRSILGALGETTHHQLRECRGELWGALLQRRRVLRDVRGEHFVCPSFKRHLPTQQFVRDDARRVEIGAVIHIRIAGGLLRGHVGGGAERHANGGEGAFFGAA